MSQLCAIRQFISFVHYKNIRTISLGPIKSNKTRKLLHNIGCHIANDSGIVYEEDHADEEQDMELIKSMLDKYLGKESYGEAEMKHVFLSRV